MRALIIDDSRAVRVMIGRFLKELGFESVEAGHGAEALERLGPPGQVDLALVDWNMPIMTGIEFVRVVRGRPEYAALRVLMVTTESETTSVQTALEAGANEYLMKPFTRDALRDRIELLGLPTGAPASAAAPPPGAAAP